MEKYMITHFSGIVRYDNDQITEAKNLVWANSAAPKIKTLLFIRNFQ